VSIAYLGLPMTGSDAAVAAVVLPGRHAFVSFAEPSQLPLARELCASYAVDNGAFSAWRQGRPVTDWRPFYDWINTLDGPLDFCVIPDVIDGDEQANDRLVREWPHGDGIGAPVWHLHESLTRLQRLVWKWPRVCLGSSGAYSTPGTESWWNRMEEAMAVACDGSGIPFAKLHGLRMMDPDLYRIPFHSVDSTSVGRNTAIDGAWQGRYAPPTKGWRAVVLAARFEHNQAAPRWVPSAQMDLGVA
jgi:hypothetical protein